MGLPKARFIWHLVAYLISALNPSLISRPPVIGPRTGVALPAVGVGSALLRQAEIDASQPRQPFTGRRVRSLAHIFVGGQHINAEMVRRGAAWVFLRDCNDPTLLRLQQEAQAARRGLWALPDRQQVPPWEWRESRRRSR